MLDFPNYPNLLTRYSPLTREDIIDIHNDLLMMNHILKTNHWLLVKYMTECRNNSAPSTRLHGHFTTTDACGNDMECWVCTDVSGNKLQCNCTDMYGYPVPCVVDTSNNGGTVDIIADTSRAVMFDASMYQMNHDHVFDPFYHEIYDISHVWFDISNNLRPPRIHDSRFFHRDASNHWVYDISSIQQYYHDISLNWVYDPSAHHYIYLPYPSPHH